MPRQDTVDFLTAFAVGTVLGIGATLLLHSEPAPKARLVRQLKPYKKQMRRSYRQAREAVRDSASATGDLTADTIAAGRELLGEFRSEVAEILGGARAELRDMVTGQARGVTRGARKTRRKFGL